MLDRSDATAVSFVEHGVDDCLVASTANAAMLEQTVRLARARVDCWQAKIQDAAKLPGNVSDRRSKPRSDRDRRCASRYLITRPLITIPVRPDGAPDKDGVCEAFSIDVSTGGIGFQIASNQVLPSRLGTLGIVSGAFGAFQRSALERVGGWDVGPGEDEDVVLRLRKLGYRIEFAPYAECYTDVPASLRALTKQRRRWEWAVVTFESRKHIDLANPLLAHFDLKNFLLVVERWLFNLFLPLWFWVYLVWLVCFRRHPYLWHVLVLYYLAYVVIEMMLWLVILYYSNHKRRDARLFWLTFLMPGYQAYQRCVTTVAIVEEMLTRKSFRDGFVPQHVREATWRW